LEFVDFSIAPNNSHINLSLNNDDLSVLTMNSSTEPNEPDISDEKKTDETNEIKKKRIYKPRKKKESL